MKNKYLNLNFLELCYTDKSKVIELIKIYEDLYGYDYDVISLFECGMDEKDFRGIEGFGVVESHYNMFLEEVENLKKNGVNIISIDDIYLSVITDTDHEIIKKIEPITIEYDCNRCNLEGSYCDFLDCKKCPDVKSCKPYDEYNINTIKEFCEIYKSDFDSDYEFTMTLEDFLIEYYHNELSDELKIECMDSNKLMLALLTNGGILNLQYNSKCRIKKENLPKGYVYLIKAHDKYKIGKTKNLNQRLKTISTSIGEVVDIIYTTDLIENYSKLECELHRIFSKSRVKGEWFNLNENDIKKAKKLMKAKENKKKKK